MQDWESLLNYNKNWVEMISKNAFLKSIFKC